jgi:hypothetical protein
MLSDSALSARINLSLEKILKDQGITVNGVFFDAVDYRFHRYTL